MSNLQQAAHQALEALESIYNDKRIMVPREQDELMNTAITNLKKSLGVSSPNAFEHVVGYRCFHEGKWHYAEHINQLPNDKWFSMFDMPIPVKGLSDFEITLLHGAAGSYPFEHVKSIVREVERAHGIGKKT